MKQMSVGEYAMLPPQSCSKFAEGALILILSAYMGYATRYSFKKKKKRLSVNPSICDDFRWFI